MLYQLFSQEKNTLELHKNDKIIDLSVDFQRDRKNYEEEKTSIFTTKKKQNILKISACRV